MTREEAIENFKSMIEAKSQLNAYGVNNKYDFRVGNNFFNALDMAIKALETLEEFEKAQIITGGRLNGRTYAYKCGLEDGKRKALEQEPCEDCISRAEAQKHIYRRLWESALNNVGYECKAEDVFMDIADNRLSTWISEIPSIQPKPKTDVLDKIKAEIEGQVLESLSDGGDDWFVAEKVNECLEIIDKYKAEREDKE